MVDGASAARFARERARPVADPTDIGRSARNRFVGLVTAVDHDGVMARVELHCVGIPIEVVMTAEAAREMHLEPGRLAVAVVKATEVEIDRGGYRSSV